MIKKFWTVHLEDGPHTVQLEQNWFATAKQVRLDGQILEGVKCTKTNLGDTDYEFMIGTHPCKVMVRNNFWTYQFDLAVDEKSVTTGDAPRPHTTLPRWSIFFFVACGIIPLMVIGLIPAVIGVGGVFGCAFVSRDESRSEKTRILICVGITALAWILFIGLTAGVAALASG